ncbi:MAG: stage II sporulation protein P [Clostridia bacterium]|nr:stage II sporulation protein P [Clostridia bacterium]
MRKRTFIVGIKAGKRAGLICAALLFAGMALAAFYLDKGFDGGKFIENYFSKKKVHNLRHIPQRVLFSEAFLGWVLKQGFPVLIYQEEGKALSPGEVFKKIVLGLTEIDVEDPRTLIGSQLNFLIDMEKGDWDTQGMTPYPEENNETTAKNGESAAVSNSSPENATDTAGEVLSVGDNPLVGIYNTHNSETYMATDGVKHKKGKNGGVVRVAEVLESCLKNKYGITVIRSAKIHDYPDWSLSYSKSKETAKNMLAQHPSIQILLDIHRDAGLKEKKIVNIKGKDAAQILLIVGSNKRLPHPNWEKNKEFAQIINKKMNEMYPGLSRGVRVQNGRYNQHLHPHAILVEIGSVKNSLQEAEYSAELFAGVIHEVLKDLTKKTL